MRSRVQWSLSKPCARAPWRSAWSGDLLAQHRHLVSEYEDLGVLGRLPAAEQCEPSGELAEDEVEQL
jgi:hypothetical protein